MSIAQAVSSGVGGEELTAAPPANRMAIALLALGGLFVIATFIFLAALPELRRLRGRLGALT